MAVTDLHEAALVLQGAHQAIAKLLAETEPMQRAYHARIPHPLSDEELDALGAETGYDPFWTATRDLIDLLDTVEDMDREEADKRSAA